MASLVEGEAESDGAAELSTGVGLVVAELLPVAELDPLGAESLLLPHPASANAIKATRGMYFFMSAPQRGICFHTIGI